MATQLCVYRYSLKCGILLYIQPSFQTPELRQQVFSTKFYVHKMFQLYRNIFLNRFYDPHLQQFPAIKSDYVINIIYLSWSWATC